MSKLGAYMLSVIAGAMVLGILNSMLDRKGSAGTLLRLMGGLFLTFTVIQPIAGFDFSAVTAFWEDFSLAGETAAALGQSLAEEELAAVIKERAETYILDKAKAYEAELTVEVMLSDDTTPVPTGVTLRGSISPYAKAQLQKILEDDLGIAKEDQQWIG